MGKRLYHGSNVRVEHPVVKISGFYKDFGFGVYCTELERQARRWAIAKRPAHIVNVYDLQETTGLRELHFPQMSDKWLDFVVDCRRGKEHPYDIVEGPMADDAVWDYVEDFANGNISREAFWALARFKYPTHQIVFCTEDAIRRISFVESFCL